MIIKRRTVPDAQEVFVGLPPLLKRIYLARGVSDVAELDKTFASLLSYHALKDIDGAIDRLCKALNHQESICVIGDFDADGATSTALLVSALKAYGAQHVSYLVPNRFDFGYGLTPAIVEVALAFNPTLIITVDNGITSIEGVAFAKRNGIDVLITDHHLPGAELPEAIAIVNPNQPGDAFQSKSLAGVGVIFYVMTALRAALNAMGWFQQQAIEVPNLAHYLDLVALGTVADVVTLDQNNRILVEQGLKRIRQGLARPGIYALLSVAKRDYRFIRETDLGFSVAPRLNAAGRLEDMSLGIACLLSDSLDTAMPLAVQLDELNQARRSIERDMKLEALAELESLSLSETELPLGLCVWDKHWHQGVIGILAGRLKERYHRPVIVLAQANEAEWKGSARSIPELNIRDVLALIDAQYPGLILKFGGHAMAAGLTVLAHELDRFKEVFNQTVSAQLSTELCKKIYLTDGGLSLDEMTLEMAKELQAAGPWGQHFPPPLFHNRFEVLTQTVLGEHHLKLLLKHEEGGAPISAIAFFVDRTLWPDDSVRFIEAVYALEVNIFRQKETLQLQMIGMKKEVSCFTPNL